MTFSWAHEGLEGDEIWGLELVSGSLLLHPHAGMAAAQPPMAAYYGMCF